MTYEEIIFFVYLIDIFIMSIYTFYIYYCDKKYSQINNERIAEKKLLFYVVLGGAIGGFIARIIFHHKTQKLYFSIVIYLSLLIELITLVILLLSMTKAIL